MICFVVSRLAAGINEYSGGITKITVVLDINSVRVVLQAGIDTLKQRLNRWVFSKEFWIG